MSEAGTPGDLAARVSGSVGAFTPYTGMWVTPATQA